MTTFDFFYVRVKVSCRSICLRGRKHAVMIIKIVLISIAVTLLAMAGRVGFAVLTVLRNIKRYAKPRIEQIDLSSMLDPDGIIIQNIITF